MQVGGPDWRRPIRGGMPALLHCAAASIALEQRGGITRHVPRYLRDALHVAHAIGGRHRRSAAGGTTGRGCVGK